MPLATYSIVGCDVETGECGAAVQSHWFSVGAICIWTRPGCGAAATQATVEPAHGPHLLDRLGRGESVADALSDLLRADPLAALRQLGVVDAGGESAGFTGEGCLRFAGHQTGPGFSCQANIMANETVPAAMADAFVASHGDLADRLLSALRAAEAEGGDLRGRQSAAIRVAPAEGEPWQTTFDVRVDDHADPLDEISRLLRLQRAYNEATAAEELMANDDFPNALECYRKAIALAPESEELRFWTGLATAHVGDVDAGAEMIRDVVGRNASWLRLLERLPASEVPAAQTVLGRLREN